MCEKRFVLILYIVPDIFILLPLLLPVSEAVVLCLAYLAHQGLGFLLAIEVQVAHMAGTRHEEIGFGCMFAVVAAAVAHVAVAG